MIYSAVSDTVFTLIVGGGISFWIASMAAMWKVATLLSSVSSELKQLNRQTEQNTANIFRIQQRFNIPQATEEDICKTG